MAGKREISELEEQVRAALDLMRFKLMVLSGKGGVGKSTVACCLALGLAEAGYRVGLMDVDLHGPSVPRMLGISGRSVREVAGMLGPVEVGGVKVMSLELLLPRQDASVIWRGPIKAAVIRQLLGECAWGVLDYLVIDCPPGTGDEPLTVAQLVDGALGVVVSTPQEIALADVRKCLDFCRQTEVGVVGMVENMAWMSCPHCGGRVSPFGSQGAQRLAEEMGLVVLGSLPIDPQITQAADEGRLAEVDLPEAFRKMVNRVVAHTMRRGVDGQGSG